MYEKIKKFIDNKLSPKAKKVVYLLGFLFIFSITYFLFLDKALNTFENYTYDIRVAIKDQFKPEKPDPNIIPVIFDDNTIRLIEKHPDIGLGRWPLPRKVMGEMHNYFIRANTSVTVFDILFNNSTDAVNDNYLANSLAKSKNTYLA